MEIIIRKLFRLRIDYTRSASTKNGTNTHTFCSTRADIGINFRFENAWPKNNILIDDVFCIELKVESEWLITAEWLMRSFKDQLETASKRNEGTERENTPLRQYAVLFTRYLAWLCQPCSNFCLHSRPTFDPHIRGGKLSVIRNREIHSGIECIIWQLCSFICVFFHFRHARYFFSSDSSNSR